MPERLTKRERDNARVRRKLHRTQRRAFLDRAWHFKITQPEMWVAMTPKQRLEAAMAETPETIKDQVGDDCGLPYRTVKVPVPEAVHAAAHRNDKNKIIEDELGRRALYTSAIATFRKKRYGYFEEKTQLGKAQAV